MSQTTERFELQTRIAAGNAGLVYRGVEKSTRRRVALKLLIDTGLPFPLDGEALLHDAARVRRTAGNNIAQLLEVLPDEDVGMVLVYEYADGANWTNAAKDRPLDGAQAVDVAAQLLSALAVGEAIKVPHGELKPSNLVLGELPGGRLFVWVLDWGLARYRPEPPPDALPWMAPEQLAGAPASTEGDLFAMGACLCWLLTGNVPVAGETREQLTAAWRQFPGNALAQVRPDLPAKFTRWVGGLLEVNPKKRFATVAAARQALAALDPPAPPVLPEIFRPRAKSALAIMAATRAASGPRAVPVPRVAAMPEETSPPAEDEPLAFAEENGEPGQTAETTGEWAPEDWPATEPEGGFATEAAAEIATEPEPEVATDSLAGPEVQDDHEPQPEAVPEPVHEPEPRLAAESAPESASEPASLPIPSWRWLAVLAAVFAVLVAARSYLHRPGGDAATGGPAETVLHRDLSPRAAFCPDGKGGTWWCAFRLAHFPESGRTGVYELQGNLFNESAIDDVIRLSFTESAGRLTVVSFPARGSATLPGPANVPQPILVRLTATPAAAGTFNVALDLWAKPNAANLGPPIFTASASKVALPPRLGVRFQKKPTAVATTTVVEAVSIGKTPAEVLK